MRILHQFVGTGQPVFFLLGLIWLTATISSEMNKCMIIVVNSQRAYKWISFLLVLKLPLNIILLGSCVLISQFGQFRPRARLWSKFSDSKTIAVSEHHLQCFAGDFERSGSLPNRPNKNFIVGLVACMIGTGLPGVFSCRLKIRGLIIEEKILTQKVINLRLKKLKIVPVDWNFFPKMCGLLNLKEKRLKISL